MIQEPRIKMHNFKNLKIWILGMDLTTDIYVITKTFPTNEMYGLISQMRRCVISIPSNIAEGTSRKSAKDVSRFLDISIGSLFELETQIFISKQLNYVNEDQFSKLTQKITELQKMIFGFQKNILNQSESKNFDS